MMTVTKEAHGMKAFLGLDSVVFILSVRIGLGKAHVTSYLCIHFACSIYICDMYTCYFCLRFFFHHKELKYNNFSLSHAKYHRAM